MREEWAEKLRLKLEGHRMTPPEGLWEGISHQMGLNAQPVSKPTVIRRWWWAAAAVVLALVGFFVFDDNKEIEVVKSIEDVKSIEVVKSIEDVKGFDDVRQLQQASVVSQQAEHENVEYVKSEEILPDSAIDAHTDAHQHTDEPEPEKEKSPETITNHPEPHHEYMPERHTSPDAVRWSVGLSASSGLVAANNTQRENRIYNDYQYSGSGSHIGNDGYAQSHDPMEYVSDHHLPIRFGVSVNYQLTPRTALLSGINYTYLYSKFTIPHRQNMSYDQKLHYLGIPLGLSCQLWSANHFHIYVSGGVMLEKCLNEKPWQWSVGASAGAEYSLTRQFGLYVEPSLGYYFKDGTSFEHYYKEHPLTPSIVFGLQFHFSK